MGLLDTVKTVLGISPYTPVDKTRVWGIDLSHWSGVCDLKKAKDYGVSFVILKAMDGVNPTKYFKENYKQSIDAGLLVGSYQWLYKTISQDSQAKAYYNLVKDYPCQITETVDFETTASGNSTFNELYNMMVRLEDLTQRKSMVYTGVSYWNVNGSQNSSFFAQRDLWLANYKVSTPTLIKPWGENWKIWQFTDRLQGSLMGVSGESMVDGNYWHSTLEELYAWCGLSIDSTIPIPVEPPIVIDVPTPPQPSSVGKKATVLEPSLNVRFNASITSPIVASSISKGTVVEIFEEKKDVQENTWGRIGIGKWICMVYYGHTYVKYNEPIVVVPIDPNLVTSNCTLNVRSGAGTNFTVVGSIPFRNKASVLEYIKGSGESIWGKIGVDKFICLFLNGVYFTDKKTFVLTETNPGPIPSASLGLYKIKDDIQANIPPKGTRPFIRNGLPSTVRLRGGMGFVMLSSLWMKYLVKINDTSSSLKYQFTDFKNPITLKNAVGWHNTGAGNRVEQLTFSGNIVEVISIEGEQAYIKTYFNNDTPPVKIVIPFESTLDTLVHLFTTQYTNRLDTSTDGRYPRVFPIANPGEKLWININDIFKI